MKKLKNEFKKQFPQIVFDQYLKNYCTFQTGGSADYFYKLKNINELPELISFARSNKLPWLIFGRGSNILFSDAGFRGLIIQNLSDKLTFKDNTVTADSGVLTSKIVFESIKRNLSPLEKWIGLPGTIGAAVFGNAGCNGLETSQILQSATLFNPKTGKIKEVDNNYFNFDYRSSKLKKTGEIVMTLTLKLKKSRLSREKKLKLMQEIRTKRSWAQPNGLSSGSFFKNPSPQKPAGYLIDQAGLKGKTVGKAQISPKHANFLLNLGGATSADIIKLARLAKREVKAKFGIDLQNEVQIISQKSKLKL